VKTIGIAVFGLAVALTGIASTGERSYINDKDGYTNVRRDPSSSSPVIARIPEGEVFISYAEKDASWYQVETKNRIKGYVHKSRIQSFAALEAEIAGFFNTFLNTPSNHAEDNEVLNEELFSYARKYPEVFVAVFAKVDSKTQRFILDQLESPVHDLIDLKLIYGRINAAAGAEGKSSLLKAIAAAGSKIGMKLE